MPRKRASHHRATRPAGLPEGYPALLEGIKQRIHAARVRATLAANAELIRLYWDIGRAIDQRQQREGWGAGVIPRLARDIRNDLPEVKGFSERNIKRMLAFCRAYGDLSTIVPQAAAQLPEASSRALPPAILPQPAAKLKRAAKVPQPVAQLKSASGRTSVSPILPQPAAKLKRAAKVPQPAAQLQAFDGAVLLALPWFHHVLLMEKIKDLPTRLWYMQQAVAQGWSRSVLALMIDNRAHARQGRAVTNFDQQLPPPQSDMARQILKDPYIFDFLTLEEPFHERELEAGLLIHAQKFLLELGQGFAFVGRQYHLGVGQEDFYIDLLFYHLRLRCFVVIDLKKGPFRPEYAGKMNFYCNVVDDRLRHPADQPTIGLILCQDKNRLVAEYALKGVRKAIGVSQYQLTRALPAQLKSSLPSIEEIEAELSAATVAASPRRRSKAKKPGR